MTATARAPVPGGAPTRAPALRSPSRAGGVALAALLALAPALVLAGCEAPGSGDGGPGARGAVAEAGTSPGAAAADPGRRTATAFPEGWPYPADASPVPGREGMVVTTDTLASAAGLEILKAGGNAVDAAIAVQFALAVVHPQAGNIGGGGFLVARTADDVRLALDFREEAPGDATRDMYLDEAGEVTDESWTGPLAAGVPGSVAGMEAAWRRSGTLPWARLLEPAIRYARDGFRVREDLHGAIRSARERLARFPSSAAVFLPDGGPPAVGSTFRQPDLARTLQAVADSGARVFYEGWVADSLAAQMARSGGIIDGEDLAAYEAVWREPIQVSYRGREVVSMPPPSSGGVTLGEMLNLLSGWELGEMAWHDARHIHLMVEAMRRAYADRNYYLGDPDFIEMPIARLLSDAYADSLRATIDPERASPSERFDRVPRESPETTHFSVVDGEGNAVAVTTTLNGGFGSAVVVRGGGFLLNNEMDDFAAKPGVPNAYGLVQGEANAIRPGARMLSSMTPTVVVGPRGRTELVTGTPGGATIITTVLQILTNELDWGLGVQTAVNAPRFHHQHLPDRVFYEENGLRREVVEALRAMGHEVDERSGISGDVQSIRVGPEGTLHGASDPRRGGTALGY